MLDINDVLGKINENLEKEDTIPDEAFDYLENKISSLNANQKINFQPLSQLTSLCLYYEDMLNRRPEIYDHSLFSNIVDDLKRKRKEYNLFKEKYSYLSDQLLTSKQCLRYVRWFNKKLQKVERELKSQNENSS